MKIIYIAEGPGAYSSPFHLSETGEHAHCGANLNAPRWQTRDDTPGNRRGLMERGQRLCARCERAAHGGARIASGPTLAQLRDRERWIRWTGGAQPIPEVRSS